MLRPFLALTLISALPAATATAQSSGQDLGRWNMSANEQGCMVYAHSARGTVFSVWGRAGQQSLGFLVQNKEWSSLQDGGVYDLRVTFDNRGGWPVQAIAQREIDRDGPGLLFTVEPGVAEGANFMNEFADAKAMRISREGAQVDSLSLEDSEKAMAALGHCLRVVWSVNGIVDQSEAIGEAIAATTT
jgi:hypothetical protein